jgi:hypothetical protein
MSRCLRYVSATLCATLAGAPTASALPAPRLSPPQAETVALAAARPYASGNGSITAERAQLGHIGKKLVWLVHLRAPSFRLGCENVPAGSYCVPSFLGYALVTIADAGGHVLYVHAASN